MAALDLADVQRARPHVFKTWQRKRQQPAQHLNQFVHRRVAEFRIGGVSHLAGCLEDRAQRAFRGQCQAIVRRFSIDQKAAALGREVRGLGAGRVALFARNKQQPNPKPSRAQRIRGGYLRRDNSLGV